MGIDKHIRLSTSEVVLTEDIQNKWDQFLPYIKENVSYKNFDITTNNTDIYKGDFYGLLATYGVTIDNMYPTLILNGFKSPFDYNGTTPILMFETSDSMLGMIKNKIAGS